MQFFKEHFPVRSDVTEHPVGTARHAGNKETVRQPSFRLFLSPRMRVGYLSVSLSVCLL